MSDLKVIPKKTLLRRANRVRGIVHVFSKHTTFLLKKETHTQYDMPSYDMVCPVIVFHVAFSVLNNDKKI